MILAIDSSSVNSALALLDGDRVAEVVKPSGREFDVAAEVARLVTDLARLDGVLLALGPGSFTGLRQGIAFGVGLAMSLGVQLYGVGTLELAAARARGPAVAVSEAGRGRVYFLAPDGRRGLAEQAEVPREWPAVGWIRSAGLEMVPEAELKTFGEAAAAVWRTAKRVGYGTVRPEYMHSFGSIS